MKKGITLGVIYGNRDFFPDILITEARQEVEQVLKEMGIGAIAIGDRDAKLGAVETYQHAKICAAHFKKQQDEIDGILVVLANFGDEKGVADTIRLSGLQVPILIQAYADDLNAFTVQRRRDAFCGKISVCNNLRQYGYPFSLTSRHTESPLSDTFKKDLGRFAGICRVVRGLKKARLGAIGARPNAFITVRFSEKILESYGIQVNTIDLSEIFAKANKLADGDKKVAERLAALTAYVPAKGVPRDALIKMSKLAVAIEDWMAENEIQASAVQCWNSVQENYGVNVCTIMSMMSDRLMPSACEVDITGVASMYALQLASGEPSALVDWNNNYGDDPNKCVLFHCGNWAKSLYPDASMNYAEILATMLGEQNTYGALAGRIAAGPLTYARISTDDLQGSVQSYLGEGMLTNDPLDTFGSRAVLEVPELQALMHYICKNGFEHHTAINATHVAEILKEAFENYLGWQVYYHKPVI
jgi:L-fucose isomerase-like protein